MLSARPLYGVVMAGRLSRPPKNTVFAMVRPVDVFLALHF
jgi:hypothetical protein